MFEFIEGTLSAKHLRYAVLDVGGIGYRIETLLSAGEKLTVGKSVRFYIHSVLREDSHSLYGFLEPEERRLFLSLISVSSVGPKLAMNILGSLSIADLQNAISEGNVGHLVSVPSIGDKMARRLINELGDSVRLPLGREKPGLSAAEEALVSLGYKPQEATAVIAKIKQPNMETEELVRAALKDLAEQRRG